MNSVPSGAAAVLVPRESSLNCRSAAVRLDDDILEWFRQQVDDAGGGNYQTLINEALRGFIQGKQESLETTLRRVIRDELRRAG
jgi:BrnA antitoxin of type II toxin-antitoxin system